MERILKEEEILTLGTLNSIVNEMYEESRSRQWPDTLIVHHETFEGFLKSIDMSSPTGKWEIGKPKVNILGATLNIYQTQDIDINKIIVK